MTDHLRVEPTRPDDPFFVVGCARSGTTLLSVMLDRHPELAVTRETHFINKALPYLRMARRTHEAQVDCLLATPLMADLEVDREGLLDCFRRHPCEPSWLLKAVLETHGRGVGVERVGEKTPMHLEYTRLLYRWFPDARVVGIVRDGRDVAQSLMHVDWVHNDLMAHAARWVQQSRIARRLARRHARRFLLVRYEDLLAEPRETLSRVDAFLGVAFDERQLDPEAGGTEVFSRREMSWKNQAAKALDRDRIAAWKRGTDAGTLERLNAVMRPELVAHGYPEARRTLRLTRRGLGLWLDAAHAHYRHRRMKARDVVRWHARSTLGRLGVRNKAIRPG